MKKNLMLLLLASLAILSVIFMQLFLPKDSANIYLNNLKINDRLPFSGSDKREYFIPVSQNKLHISLKAQNADKVYIYEGNKLINEGTISEDEYGTDLEIQPNTKELRVIFENKGNKLEKYIALLRTSLTIDEDEEVMSFISDNDFYFFLVGSSNLQLPISKYEGLYLYKERIQDHTGEKLQLSNIITSKGTLHKIDDDILVDLPVDKSYDTPLHRGLILRSDTNQLNILWDSEYSSPSIKLEHKQASVDILVDAKSIQLEYAALTEKLPEGSYGNQNRYELRGISRFVLEKEAGAVLKVFYPLYNMDMAPALELGYLVVSYKIKATGLDLYSADFQS